MSLCRICSGPLQPGAQRRRRVAPLPVQPRRRRSPPTRRRRASEGRQRARRFRCGLSASTTSASTEGRLKRQRSGMPAVIDSYALPIGTGLGEYRIDAVLGSGGFGITYRALDTRLDTPVALKEYFPASLAYRIGATTVGSRPDGTAGGYEWGMEKFVHEAMALARLQHP